MSELVAVRIIRHLRCSVDHRSLVWMKSSYLLKDEEIRLWPPDLSKLCDFSNSLQMTLPGPSNGWCLNSRSCLMAPIHLAPLGGSRYVSLHIQSCGPFSTPLRSGVFHRHPGWRLYDNTVWKMLPGSFTPLEPRYDRRFFFRNRWVENYESRVEPGGFICAQPKSCFMHGLLVARGDLMLQQFSRDLLFYMQSLS